MKLTEEMKNFAEGFWEAAETCEPDISTERLMQMVADGLTIEFKKEFDVGDVANLMAPDFKGEP